MELKFFFTYIGSLFVLSTLLALVVKNFAEGYAGQGRKPILYGTFSSILASVVVYACNYITDNLFTIFWVFASIFLLFGIVHVSIVRPKYFYAREHNKNKVFIGEVFFALSVILFAIVVFSALQYFLKGDHNFLFFPMMLSTLAFFIPTLVLHTFEAAYGIPPTEYKTWLYPLYDEIDLPPEDPRERLLVIGFEIAKKETDKKTYFRIKAPEGIRLGDLYYHFLNDYNEVQSESKIAFTNNTNQPYEWWFRMKTKWWQPNRILNPDISVRENGITENSVIICERLMAGSQPKY
jgi:hypothetical protein